MDQSQEKTESQTPPASGAAAAGCGCGAKPGAQGGEQYTPVFAIGRIEARFPRTCVEKEFVQAVSGAKTAGMTDHQAMHAVLADRQNRYLARKMCWVLTIEKLETYLLQPRDPADFEFLIDALRPAPQPSDVDVVIGYKGPIAPPQVCNGLMLPALIFERVYSFDRDTLLRSIPGSEQKAFRVASEELFDRIMQMADNAGASNEHRALNYLAVRYPAIYSRAAEAFAQNSSLSAVEVRPSRLSGLRAIVDVIFSYTSRQTDVTEKHFVRVDVTDEFPFLVTKLSPFYDR